MRIAVPSPRAWLWAFVLFCVATAIMLHQQVLAYKDVPDLGDPLFSMWRLAWVAHQLPLDPGHLFDANIFHPAARTLAYSDATIFPALIGAPALWLGAPLAAVYTSLLLFSFVAAGVAMFVLVHGVTGHEGAASIGGLVFAFDPFRFSHYSHLELQFTFCMPLAVLFLLRTLATGSRGDGAFAGMLMGLQGLCSLYYGAYLAVSLVVLVVCWIGFVERPRRRTLVSLALAFAIATAISIPIARPYLANRATLGERRPDEVREYSATGRDYLTVNRRSAVYGSWLGEAHHGERQLFPGLDAQVALTNRQSSRLATLDVPRASGDIAVESTGSARYREVQVSVRRTWALEQQLFVSYVRSYGKGELNDFATVFQDLDAPLVQPGGVSWLPSDARDRILAWGTFNLPRRVVISPVTEWRSGFPYSAVDARYLYAGSPNGRRFPSFVATDIVVYKTFTVRKRSADLGVQVFNLANHRNPRDVYSVVGAPAFGQFTNSVGPILRGYMLLKL